MPLEIWIECCQVDAILISGAHDAEYSTRIIYTMSGMAFMIDDMFFLSSIIPNIYIHHLQVHIFK